MLMIKEKGLEWACQTIRYLCGTLQGMNEATVEN